MKTYAWDSIYNDIYNFHFTTYDKGGKEYTAHILISELFEFTNHLIGEDKVWLQKYNILFSFLQDLICLDKAWLRANPDENKENRRFCLLSSMGCSNIIERSRDFFNKSSEEQKVMNKQNGGTNYKGDTIYKLFHELILFINRLISEDTEWANKHCPSYNDERVHLMNHCEPIIEKAKEFTYESYEKLKFLRAKQVAYKEITGIDLIELGEKL